MSIYDKLGSIDHNNDEYIEEGIATLVKNSFNSNWKIADQSSTHKTFKSNTITEEEFENLHSLIKTLRTCETYNEYKPAFRSFCKFCHIVPDGTIITSIQLKSGSKKDKNYLYVEYSYNTRKIKLEENQQLYHISKIDGIKELIPFFRGKSERGYLYDKPRIYLSIHEKIPKIMADYSSKNKMYYYKVLSNITDVYVDPLLKYGAMGAVYVETNKPIPVENISK